jgi:thiamine pyrophosphate-dependent acetolactate synthase large subunit-like protein
MKKLDRREVVARLLENRQNVAAITSLGSPTYDLSAAGDHERNFYLWGAMGGATGVGLGLAIAQPDLPVVVFIGDGEALMGLGGLATLAIQRPKNLSIVILDNGLYGETGSQLSHTSSGVKLAEVARGCGVEEILTIRDKVEVDQLAARINCVGAGPLVAVVEIDGEEKARHLPSRDGVYLKNRLRASLGFGSM